MDHSLKDLIVTAAAIAVPILTWLLMKLDSRELKGRLLQTVDDHGRRINTLEGVQTQIGQMLVNHGERIVRVETVTKSNGRAAAGGVH